MVIVIILLVSCMNLGWCWLCYMLEQEMCFVVHITIGLDLLLLVLTDLLLLC
jgi:hypothetical protein